MVKNKHILVTGSLGQLGTQIRNISKNFSNYKFTFSNKKNLDISKFDSLKNFVLTKKIDLIINCAAYTNVEMANKNRELADLINNISVGNIAKICLDLNIKLIHISTDFVFEGINNKSYIESDLTKPVNFYGLSKLNGELNLLKKKLKNSIIIRTSWLYSESSNNFVVKILKKIFKKDTLLVVNNEFGSPTYAKDLAESILKIIPDIKNSKTEIYHYCNTGVCSRYDFANEINTIVKGEAIIKPNGYNNSQIKRPKFTALNCNKFVKDFNIEPIDWKKSLKYFLKSKIKLINHEK